jgi:quinoprotein glucose dehydrogenase
MRSPIRLALLLSIAALLSIAEAQQGARAGDWRFYGGDAGGTKYSPLDEINPDNVKDVEVAWTWTTVDAPLQVELADDDPAAGGATYFQCTPLKVGSRLYVVTCLNQVAAINAATGETIWVFDPKTYDRGRPPQFGYVSRSIAYWEDGGEARIFMATGHAELIAIDAATGKIIESFAEEGRADFMEGVPRARLRTYGNSSGPAICNDTVVVGSNISDGPTTKEAAPGRVMGFDARTGKRKWVFNLIPQESEFGVDTWEDESWTYSGGANVWSLITTDPELGYVYLPTTTPTNDFYGGHRPGDNLFAESLVCLNAETGERIWHFQTVHHGLWDYDNPSPPNLVDITVDGTPIKAVAQVTKQGFVFVFDRITGEPVWPIEERAVPQSTVPGEKTSPTQPFPTKPPPFERQGFSAADVIDFTPELHAEALEILKQYHTGPLFTPPAIDKPVIILPGIGGGANWPGAGFDPETNILYVPSMSQPMPMQLGEPDPNRSNFRYTRIRNKIEGPRGLPLIKPPYGRITAIDLNKGEHVWMAVNGGDGPRDHPAIAHLDLPALGTKCRAGVLVTKSILWLTEGAGRSGSATGGGTHLRALNKTNGEELCKFELPSQPTGVPMTYEVDGKQYVVLAIGSTPAQLIAFSTS